MKKEISMLKISRKWALTTILLIGLLLFSMGCLFEGTQTSTPIPPSPTIILITQTVTQVVIATPTPIPISSTPISSQTADVTATFDPYSVGIYYPLKDCVASRLHKGDRAYVSYGGGPNAIRYGTDLHNDTIAGYAQEGEGMLIIDGPWCNYGWLVWMVQTDSGLTGFTPEGDGNEYWLLPLK